MALANVIRRCWKSGRRFTLARIGDSKNQFPPLPLWSLSLPLSEFEVALSSLEDTFNNHRRWLASLAGTTKNVRDDRFSRLTEEDISHFRQTLGGKGLVLDQDELKVANIDWTSKYQGHSQILLRPENTHQVSEILKYCNSRFLAVVPQGGNTGLVGGSVPVFDEIVMNLGAMNKIISFDETSGIVVCEAGCILQSLDDYLGSRGCNQTTNAIVCIDLLYLWTLERKEVVKLGEMCLRMLVAYDCFATGQCTPMFLASPCIQDQQKAEEPPVKWLQRAVKGLEVVLADGTILDLLRNLRKDNTGYDLKHFFIGAEGTLGVVTKVTLLTPPKLPSVNVAFLAVKDFANCQKVLVKAKRQLGEILSAFEFIDRPSLELVLKHSDGLRNPLPDSSSSFYILVETTGSSLKHDKEKLDAFLESAVDEELMTDGTVAQDMSQAASLWKVREGIPEALMKEGAVYKYDLSLPVKHFYDLVENMRARLTGVAVVFAWGHLGDGNLHLNISAPKYDDKVLAKIEPYVYEQTASLRGSISAEHGLGVMKATEIHYSKPQNAVQLMLELKSHMDPNGILNPYKVLPESADPRSLSQASG